MPRFVLAVAANALEVIMGVFMLTCMIGIPYFNISTAWGWMTNLWDEHPLICVLLVVPVCGLVYKAWKWGYQTLGVVLMSIGSAVDRLERP